MRNEPGKGNSQEDESGNSNPWNDPPENAGVNSHVTDPGCGSRALEIEMAGLEVMQEMGSQTDHQDP